MTDQDAHLDPSGSSQTDENRSRVGQGTPAKDLGLDSNNVVHVGVQRPGEPVEVVECVVRWKEAPPGSGQLVPELVVAP